MSTVTTPDTVDSASSGAFLSAYRHGFARIAAITQPSAIADPARNAATTIEQARAAHDQHAAVAVFPELGLSGYAIDDLLLQQVLLDAVLGAIEQVRSASADLLPVLVVGAPLRAGSRLFNCAVVIHRGSVLGVIPKSALPTYREFYERRHFAPGDDQAGRTIDLPGVMGGTAVPFGPDLLFTASDVPGLTLHAEICEDMWIPVPPSSRAALAGATVLANLSGSPITIARAEDRKLLARSASVRCLAAYVYAAAGQGESTTDLSWDGQTFVYENGHLLAETERFPDGPRMSLADVDVAGLVQDRLRQGTFDDNARTLGREAFRTVPFTLGAPGGDVGLLRPVERFPFVPADPARLAQDCYEAYNIQVSGLERRLDAIGSRPVIGVSGGLDSTHALLVAAQAMDRIGRPRSDILAYTMPGFATSARTRANAERLTRAIGATFEEIDIRPACLQMLRDMGHPAGHGAEVYDVTFENVQAGMRYDYLFRLANQHGGIVVGTGDLSELALGWCTYGVGDQMSHYAVNCGVPKTMMQHLIRWVIGSGDVNEETAAALRDILDTEISPELVPVKEGEKPQSTEGTIGPYALHDFALYHLLRKGRAPSTIAYLALEAWQDRDRGTWPAGYPDAEKREYDLPAIKQWLTVFCRRFVTSQFKRSAIPNGPKVLAGGSLSPRGDWRMPSDASPRLWLEELERNVP